MDQKNEPANGVTPPDATNAPNEVNVDLSSLQTGTDGAAPSNPDSTGAAQGPVSTDTPAPDAPTVAFTTDSSGNIQAVATPEQPDAPVIPPTDPAAPTVQPVESFEQPAVGSESPNPADLAAPVVASEVSPVPNQDEQSSVVAPAPDPNGMPQPPVSADVSADVAPVPAPHKDKKLLVILSVVAVVLLVAIVAMMFV